jgi:hypothetical protein
MTVTEVSPSAAGRTLYSIPILHTQADMGKLGGSVEKLKISTFGRERANRGANLADKVWDDIERTIETLPLPSGQVRIYQDGLPFCGVSDKIVTDKVVSELAESGSRNHQLLLRLQARGASLMGTESPKLLAEEYNHALAGFRGAKAPGRTGRVPEAADSLLEKRDRYIAGRINGTLSRGETAILFLGMLHAVERFLEPDIQVIHPVRLPQGYR